MDGTQRFDELRALRVLCDESSPRKARQDLLDSLHPDSFSQPERQIIFESIRALFPAGPITPERLLVHLTRRGFPDTDVAQYFQTP